MRRHLADNLEEWMSGVMRELDNVIPVLEAEDAHAGLAKAWRLLGHVHGSVLRWMEQGDALQKALEHARLAGDGRLEARLVAEYTACLRDGPTPATVAIRECEAALERGLDDRQANAFVLCSLARLRAMQGDIEVARDLILRAGQMRDELGANVIVPLTSLQASRVEMLGGDPHTAEQALRLDFDKLSAMGDKYALPLVGALLARAVCEQGRYADAAEWHATAAELADEQDVETQAILRSVQALLLANDLDFPAAEQAAADAVSLLQDIESLDLRADCLLTLANVMAAAKRTDDARAALQQAHDLYALKENRISAERARELMLELGAVTEQAV